MLGPSVGQIRLKASRPPTATLNQAWTSKMVYSALPGKAGFLDYQAVTRRCSEVQCVSYSAAPRRPIRSADRRTVLPLALGANVLAVLLTNLETWQAQEMAGQGRLPLSSVW